VGIHRKITFGQPMKSPFQLFFFLFRESFLFAFTALRVNKLRTILSLLGITIGIFAIISVFTVTDALENKIRTDVSSLGNNVIYVQKWPWGPEGDGGYPWWKYINRPLPGYREMEELSHRTQSVEAMAYVATVSEQTVKYKSSSIENAGILCISHQYDRIKNFTIKDGRYFNELESSSGVPLVILGNDVAEALFPAGDAIGQNVSIRGYKFNVIGVLEKEGSSMVDNSSDKNVMIPVNYARRLVDLRSDDLDPYIMVKAKENVSTEEMKEDLRGGMRSVRKLSPHDEDNFSLNEISVISGGLEAVFYTLNLGGWIIGGFSILVGAFGIANIMFVSVRERTHIIGIQKSLGSKSYFILLQFLVEAVTLCIIGGGIGLTLVYILSLIASAIVDFNLVLTFSNVIEGLMISAIVGIISGIVPAWKASAMNPVDAIRTN